MAKTKNTFIKSRMNKDLDERLVPNGEYRDAVNVQISQSEDADIGTLSTALGNSKISDFGLSNNCGARIIGLYADEKEKYLYVFITNFIDSSNTQESNYPPTSVINQIWRRNIETNENTKLVEGRFLNFSLNNFILNIDLIEDLLFWTDNRNQPRKINVKKANPAISDSPTYYTTEDHISVAKYAPFESISLMKDYLVNFQLTNTGGGTGGGGPNPNIAAYGGLIGQVLPTQVQSTTGTDGQGLTVIITATDINGNIVTLEIANEGSGYSNGDVILISPRSGSASITLSIENQSTMKNKCEELLPEVSTFGIAAIVSPNPGLLYNNNVVGSGFSIQCDSLSTPFTGVLTDIDGVYDNCFIKVFDNGTDVTPYKAVIDSLVYDTNYLTYFLKVSWPSSQANISLSANYVITVGVNPDYDAKWPGDCDYLKDKFIRFAYRFKFDDNEYSLISPFTQACFIPRNNGYFLQEKRDTNTLISLKRLVTGTIVNYTLDDEVTITSATGGAGATGKVTSVLGEITVLEPGAGFINGETTIIGGLISGSGVDFIAETEGTFYDSDNAFISTENNKFENSVNNIDLEIPCPRFLNSVESNWSNLKKELHVDSLEIIYKDDAENVLKILDTIESVEFVKFNQNLLSYSYQSTVPIKTLPEQELIRVSDKVPLKAVTQSVSGNRIIYGNYVDGHSSNLALNYQVASAKKLSVNTPTFSTLKKEYQNHTLKQNRTYQVGVVLSDRYGRQSDVILSTLDTSISGFGSSIEFGGSTLRNDYYTSNPGLIQPGGPGVLASTWPGDSLIVQFNGQVPSENGIPGYPGLFIDYNDPFVSNFYGGLNYPSFPINVGVANTGVATTTTGSGAGLTIDYFTIPQPSASTSQIFSITINTPGFGYKNGDVVTISHPGGTPPSNFVNASFVYNSNINPNLTGWFSYRIVVKQQEQDYYNVYLPGIVNGSLATEGYVNTEEATLSIYGDNINKIPKDLTNVGPNQTSFSTSDGQLFLRVQNELNNNTSSRQFYPKNNESENVVSLSELSNLGFNLSRFNSKCNVAVSSSKNVTLADFNQEVYRGMSVVITDNNGNNIYGTKDGLYVRAYSANSASGAILILNKTISFAATPGSPAIFTFGPPGVVYNSGSNPVIGSLSTSSAIGVSEEQDFVSQLAVFETEPVKSELNIFFETSSTGLISELNNAVAEGGIAGESVANISIIEILQSVFNEGATGSYNIIDDSFFALDFQNSALPSSRANNSTANLISVLDDNGADRLSEFEIVDNNNGTFNIKTTKQAGDGYYIGNNTAITTFNFTVKLTNDGTSLFKSFQGEIGNLFPTYKENYTGNYNKIPMQNARTARMVGGRITSGVAYYQFVGDYPYVFGPGIFNGTKGYPIEQFPNPRIEYNPMANPFTAFNGSGDNSLKARDIEWEIVSWITTDAVAKTLDSSLQIPFFSQFSQSYEFLDYGAWMALPEVVYPAGTSRSGLAANVQGFAIIIGEDNAASTRYGGLVNPNDLTFEIPAFNIAKPDSNGVTPAVNNSYANNPPLYFPATNLPRPDNWSVIFPKTQTLQNDTCLIGMRNINEIATDPNSFRLTQGGSSSFLFPEPGVETRVSSVPIFALVEKIEFTVTIRAKDGANLSGPLQTITFEVVDAGGTLNGFLQPISSPAQYSIRTGA
tara:strand:- start:5471 stop:10438 length:4968 start_codon:yes stop_codon:yes gene_type:complete